MGTSFFIYYTIGSLFILIGLLVRANPKLIAGYRQLDQEQKKKVDIDRIAGLMQKHLVIIGILLILTTQILPSESLAIFSVHIILGVSIGLVIMAWRISRVPRK